MRGSWLRSSPSFLIAIVLMIALAGLYTWHWWRPGPRLLSDRVVKDFVVTAYQEVRQYRRSVARVVDEVPPGSETTAPLQAIETAAQQALTTVQKHARLAYERLDDIDRLAWRTEENRRKRIRTQLREIKKTIAAIREDAATELRGGASEPTSEER